MRWLIALIALHLCHQCCLCIEISKVLTVRGSSGQQPESQPLSTHAAKDASLVQEQSQSEVGNPYLTQKDPSNTEEFSYAAVPFLSVAFLAFMVSSCFELRRFMALVPKEIEDDIKEESLADPGSVADLPCKWSVFGIFLLNGYRFYTGFMSSTWLPYLCAMDGERMWDENQSMFMAYCKLLYGFTVIFNPLYGVIADKAVSLSHGLGRRAFIRVGIFMATIGILLCFVSSDRGEAYYYPYMFGVMVWRVGEALNDVTTEALPPELVHDSQWQLASAIKAALFLSGGVLGYVLLVILVDVEYTWLYWAYLIMMLVTCAPALVLLDDDRPLKTARAHGTTLMASLEHAYLEPIRYGEGFPKACLAVFVFSLGTAPMFFFLLIVRDLVTVDSGHELQLEFSYASIMFFLSAALAAVLGPLCHVAQAGSQEDVDRRWNLLLVGIFLFSGISSIIPLVSVFDDVTVRKEALYSLAICYGATFGMAYSRFQDCTWQLLPDTSRGETATLMGFNNMCKLAGAGFGNWAAGMLLGFYVRPDQDHNTSRLLAMHGPRLTSGLWPQWPMIYRYWKEIAHSSEAVDPVYKVSGYVFLCLACATVTASAGLIAQSIKRPSEVPLGPQRLAAPPPDGGRVGAS